MTAKEAIDNHLKARLEDTFGRAVSTMIIASATAQTGVQVFDPSVEDFMRLAQAVCFDSRVQDMWGRAGAEDALAQYRGMVSQGLVS
ncbi:MAG: hypothetical protein Q7W30_03275 [Coriobacteriia bacterium]|nr:hypothetical protein [Coriobacteriia bacterium]